MINENYYVFDIDSTVLCPKLRIKTLFFQWLNSIHPQPCTSEQLVFPEEYTGFEDLLSKNARLFGSEHLDESLRFWKLHSESEVSLALDPPVNGAVELVRQACVAGGIVFLSGRSSAAEPFTRKALLSHFPFLKTKPFELILNQTFTSAHEYKAHELKRLSSQGKRLRFLFDDDVKVINFAAKSRLFEKVFWITQNLGPRGRPEAAADSVVKITFPDEALPYF